MISAVFAAPLLIMGSAAAFADDFELSAFYPEPAAAYRNLNVTGGASLARDGGMVTVGPAAGPYLAPESTLELAGESEPEVSLAGFSAAPGASPTMIMRRSRGSHASPASVLDGDLLSEWRAEGFDGSQFRTAGALQIRVDGAPSGGSVPGAFYFKNVSRFCAPPACPLENRMVIRSDGRIGIGIDDPDPLSILDIQGAPWEPLLLGTEDPMGPTMQFKTNPEGDPSQARWDVGARGNIFAIRGGHLNGPPGAYFGFNTSGTFYFGADQGINEAAAFDPNRRINTDTGGYLTTTGVWMTLSSREAKQDIRPLDDAEALEAFKELQPVRFRYAAEPDEEVLGFIAEDVPKLLAAPGRDSVHETEVLALLSKVAKIQEARLEKRRQEIERLRDRIRQLEARR